MPRRSRVVAPLVAVVLMGFTVTPVLAGDPIVRPPPPTTQTDGTQQLGAIYGWDGKTYIPLTPAEFAAVERKQRAASQSRANTNPTAAPMGIQATCRNGVCGTILATFYRHQIKFYYCGPSAVQVISNHAWNMPSGTNKYGQQYISDAWTNTDADGQTFVWRERLGLNGSTAGRYPWPFAEEYVSSGAEWHNYVVVDATDWNMPSVAGVAPHDPGFGYYLTSWPTAITAGHYIVTRGWLYLWDGTRIPIVYYNDGSAGYGGSDGQFSDPAFDIYQTIKKSNPQHSEGWIIW